MGYDLTDLETSARRHMDGGRYRDALKIYYVMSDGNSSLAGGHLAMQIGRCCEHLNDRHAAKFWYGRAVEENSERAEYAEARARLSGATIDDLVFVGLSERLRGWPIPRPPGDTGYDFNDLEASAFRHAEEGRYDKAQAIYFYMADGDTALDGGYLGKWIGDCYEHMNDPHAARYWYGRAIEENPQVNADCNEARAKLGDLSVDDLIVRDGQD
jgi:tetratricopeptide (TPR) repeat protein